MTQLKQILKRIFFSAAAAYDIDYGHPVWG